MDDNENIGKAYNVNSYQKRNYTYGNNATNNGSSNNGNNGLKMVILLIVVGIGCSIFGGILGSVITNISGMFNTNSIVRSYNPDMKIDDSYKSNIEAIADKSSPSVVGIQIKAKSSKSSRYPWLKTPDEAEAVSEGSGVIYTSDGYIITNYHVIKSAVLSSDAQVSVFTYSDLKDEKSAKIIGYDAGADIAIIKIDAENLTPVEFENSDAVRVGQTAVVIGNPAGLEFAGSVSKGIISGLNRKIKLENGVEMTLIQTDAAVNPGNSGGAIVDGTGKLIGIVNSKLVDTRLEGMGFAIPSNAVKSIADFLISRKDTAKPTLGIKMDLRYTPEILNNYGMPSGVVVDSVSEGSPAEKAGIKRGDIITKVAGKATPSAEILGSIIKNNINVNEEVPIEIYRDGNTTTVTAKLG